MTNDQGQMTLPLISYSPSLHLAGVVAVVGVLAVLPGVQVTLNVDNRLAVCVGVGGDLGKRVRESLDAGREDPVGQLFERGLIGPLHKHLLGREPKNLHSDTV